MDNLPCRLPGNALPFPGVYGELVGRVGCALVERPLEAYLAGIGVRKRLFLQERASDADVTDVTEDTRHLLLEPLRPRDSEVEVLGEALQPVKVPDAGAALEH